MQPAISLATIDGRAFIDPVLPGGLASIYLFTMSVISLPHEGHLRQREAVNSIQTMSVNVCSGDLFQT